MTEPIKIVMNKNDADMVETIFARRDDPQFTILSREDLESGEGSELVIMATSTVIIWYLAKLVQMEQDHEIRMKDIQEQIDQIKATP